MRIVLLECKCIRDSIISSITLVQLIVPSKFCKHFPQWCHINEVAR